MVGLRYVFGPLHCGRAPLRAVLVTFAMLIAATAATLANPARAASYCLYNKTRQLTVAISTEKTVQAVGAGAHYCCKPTDVLCVPQPTNTPLRWKLDANIDRRAVWCGSPDERDARRPVAITLPATDSYLLVRDSRAPNVSNGASPASAATAIDRTHSGASRPTNAAANSAGPAGAGDVFRRAPVDVDLMSADGRLLRTLPCQFTG